MILNDLFFLLTYALQRQDADNDFVFERCREIQHDPDGYLDLWAREHYKSTIITFALTIQDILINPEITVGIFSHTRPIAKGFLRQIKYELERNTLLKQLFPEVLYAKPESESPKWNEDEGITVKRRSNPKEATVEAWGLTDGMPTGKHYRLMVYDDVVTEKAVTTPEMMAKSVTSWELSRNLTAEGGASRYIGTRYHFNDAYKTIIGRGVPPRIHPATIDGTFSGEPVMWSKSRLAEKRREMGPYTAACQLMQNPLADAVQGFKFEWLRTYGRQIPPEKFSGAKCIVVDPANEKKKSSDFTAMWVLGFGADKNIYLLDALYDRLNLTERTKALMDLHKRWRPDQGTGYEKYGKDADIEHIETEMRRRLYSFTITPLGGQQPKNDRIRRLIPYFESSRVWMPETMTKTNYEGKTFDLIEVFKEEEYKPFPVGLHDDLLDAMARVFDLFPNGLPWPDTTAKSTAVATIAYTDYDEYDYSGGGPAVSAVTDYDEMRGY